jgi:hypothetical protein
MQRPLNLFQVLTDTHRETRGRGKGEERREVRDLVTLYFFTPYYIFTHTCTHQAPVTERKAVKEAIVALSQQVAAKKKDLEK